VCVIDALLKLSSKSIGVQPDTAPAGQLTIVFFQGAIPTYSIGEA
jgi:hypothetical protein